MSEERIKKLENRIQEYELEQAALVAIEKNNKKWVLGIAAAVFGILGVSYYELPKIVLERATADIRKTVSDEINLMRDDAEEAAQMVEINASLVEQKSKRISSLESRATAAVARLEEIQASLLQDGLIDGYTLSGTSSGNSASGRSDGDSASRSPASTGAQTIPVQQESWITLFEDFYAKEGYYLPVGDNLRINVNSVQGVSVEIRITALNSTNVESSEGLNTVVALTPTDSHLLGYNGSSYRITLTKIDSAGFNRLSKAAFFKVEQRN